MTDHGYELTRNEDFNLILDVGKNPTEIVAAFQLLKRRKATGIDRISGGVIKVDFEMLRHCFLYTFNKFFESAACPTEWKTAKVTPIYEGKGSRSNPDNYRMLSIIPAIYKVYSKILHARLVQGLNAYDILPESQHGFRSGHSTGTDISTLLKEVQIALDASMPFYI